MTTFNHELRALAGALAIAAAAALPAQAQLLPDGSTSLTTNFDNNLQTPVIVFDANSAGAGFGHLYVTAAGSSLTGLGLPAAQLQSYGATAANPRDLVLDLIVNQTTGTFVSGTLNIPRDLAVTTPAPGGTDSWTVTGTVTAAGFGPNGFNGYLALTSYDFSDLTAAAQAATTLSAVNPSLKCDSVAACPGLHMAGYFKVTTGTLPLPTFGSDWYMGPTQTDGTFNTASFGAPVLSYAGFTGYNFTSTADIFLAIPEPATYGLMIAGLALLPLARRLARRG